MSEALIMWTIYDHPLDFPLGFVARAYLIKDGKALVSNTAIESPFLEPLRQRMIDKGLVCLARNEADDPAIVETWL